MVFVDELREFPENMVAPRARKHGFTWCHLAADTREELHQFALKLGLKRAWFQNHKRLPHYDITPNKREEALKLGAVSVTPQQMVRILIMGKDNERPTQSIPDGETSNVQRIEVE